MSLLLLDLESAQTAFVGLLGQIEPNSKLPFLEWVCSEYNPVISDSGIECNNGVIKEEEEEPDLVDQIAASLRATVPPTALAPGEGNNSTSSRLVKSVSASNTLHVDAFLYPEEEDVEQLLRQVDVGRYHCLNCGSWKTAPLNFISHSFSKEEVKFIFDNLVPDLSNKVVIDIGSRLGPALYGGYAYSRASKLIGIEKESYFCAIQEQVVSRYNLSDRIQVVCSDVRMQAALLQLADLVILNNVFEFFCSLEEQANIWEFLFHTLRRRGTLIITTPSIQESCSQLTFKSSLSLEQWVREVNTGVAPREDFASIHLYCVL